MSYTFKISPHILELLPLAIEQHNLAIISASQNTMSCNLISPSADYVITMSEDKKHIITCTISMKAMNISQVVESPEEICTLIYSNTIPHTVEENMVPFGTHSEQDVEIAAALILKVFNEKLFRNEYAKYLSNYAMNSLIYRYILYMNQEGKLNELPDVKEITYVKGQFVITWGTSPFSYLNYASKIIFKGVN